MKKLISFLLVLVLMLSLGACGKELTLTDLLDYPVGSLEDTDAFLKASGLEIINTGADYRTFAFGSWDGHANILCVSLKLTRLKATQQELNYDEEVNAMIAQVEALCGEPYSSEEGVDFVGNQSSIAFYQYDGGTIVVSKSFDTSIIIYPGANS